MINTTVNNNSFSPKMWMVLTGVCWLTNINKCMMLLLTAFLQRRSHFHLQEMNNYTRVVQPLRTRGWVYVIKPFLSFHDEHLNYITISFNIQSCTKYLVYPALKMLDFTHFFAPAAWLLLTLVVNPTGWTLSERRDTETGNCTSSNEPNLFCIGIIAEIEKKDYTNIKIRPVGLSAVQHIPSPRPELYTGDTHTRLFGARCVRCVERKVGSR